MPNRLAGEKSPYLLQHKDNPVEWFPWSGEAFRRAREEDKPIFLSIGYSTCHWCHVMEYESFEDEEVARLMNETFVSIKVDREERPDIDGVYMTVCQMMTGQGGWPLTIFMTPDQRPFHAATYIPKESRSGRIGMVELVPRIRDVWEQHRDDVLETAGRITDALERSVARSTRGSDPTAEALDHAFEELRGRFDGQYGGFGREPKFPSPHNLTFLLRYWHRTDRKSALDMVVKTLDHLHRGGIFDHVGFGFHRYSTDRVWRLPHFEKMLYDQALLALAYAEAFQATSTSDYRRTAERIFEYVLRDLHSPEGAFYSAEDADSEGREGKFYVWSTAEVREVLDAEEAQLICDLFGLADAGNFEDEATRTRTGENVFFLRASLDDIADEWGVAAEELARRVEGARRILFAHRERRIRPGLDDKILTDWNGLMIAALARAASVFGEPALARAAREASEFILKTMRDAESGRLLHRYRMEDAAIAAHLDDYAYLIWGLLELYEAEFDAEMLSAAIRLNADLVEHYWDELEGGFFFTADDAEAVLVRRKEFYDGAVPSGNAVAMLNLVRLERITGDVSYGERAWRIARSAAEALQKMPSAFSGLLSAVDFALGPAQEIVIAGRAGAADTDALLTAVREPYLPNKVIVLRPSDEDDASAITSVAPYVKYQTPIDGMAAAYVCRNFTCDAPVTRAADLRSALEKE